MKTRIMLLFLAAIFSIGQLVAQTPQAFKYQAAIRDADGQMLEEQLISLRISILKGDTLGEAVYTEIHDVITDNMGLVNLCIGEGLPITGSLSDIQWGDDKYFTQVEMDMEGSTNYQMLGTSQLMAVPYALYAERSGDNFWENPEEGIITYPQAVGVGNLSYMDHRYGLSTVSLRVGTGNWTALDFDGEANDNQPEWRMNAHNNGYFQMRHWNGTNWDDHYLKIKPDDGFYFGASGPKLKYSFRGFIEVSDSLKVGNGNFTVSNRGYLHLTGDGSPDPMLTLQNNSHTRITALSAINKKYYRPQFEGMRARGSIDNPQDLQSDDCILSLSARPYFDGKYRQSADISFYTGANPGINSYPAYISFQTTKPNDTIRYERMRITEDGKVGIGTTDPGNQKLSVATTAHGDDRAIAHFRNDDISNKSLCNVYISSGDSGSTYLNFTAPSYIHQGGKYKMHSILGNNGKGLVFRSGQNDEGRFAFEFRREMGSTYAYDEKVSITYEGNMGIGIIHPQRKLHINDVMRLEPSFAPPENPSEGDIYMDGNEHVLKVYDGTVWKSCW